MNCDWEQVGIHEATGWRLVKCKWCGSKAVSPYPNDLIFGDCSRWPFWWEFGEWLSLLLAACFITQDGVAWVRWKLGLDEIVCECPARIAWLNTLGGRLASSPRWQWLAAWVVRRRS